MIRPSDKLQLIASGFLTLGLRVGTMLVMARFLSPADYGAYMLILAVPGLIGAMGDFGIPTTLVQLKDVSESVAVDTALVLATGLYLVYGLVTLAGGYYLSVTHGNFRFLGVAIIVAVTSWMAETYNIQLGILNRRLDFEGEARNNLVASSSTALTGLGFAIAGFGIYALALQTFVGQLAANIFIQRRTPVRWPREFSRTVAREYFSIGGKVSLAAYVSNVQANLASIAINHLSGADALGAWGRAMQVVNLLGQNLVSAVGRVMFPLLCAAADDPPRRSAMFSRSLILLMLPSAFLTSWLIVGRKDIVSIVLGAQWTLVPPLLLIAAFAIPAGVLYSTAYQVAYSLRRTGLMLRAGVVDFVLFFPILAFVWQFGVFGIAAAWVFSKFLVSTLMLVMLWRDLRPPLATILFRIGGLGVAAVVAACTMYFAGQWLATASVAPLVVRHILSSVMAFIIYLGCIALVQPTLLSEVWRLSHVRHGPETNILPKDPVTEETHAVTSDLTT